MISGARALVLFGKRPFSVRIELRWLTFLVCLAGLPLGASQADWTLRRFVPPEGTNFEAVRDIVVTDLDGVWFSSWGNGVARLKESDWKLFSLEEDHLPSDFVPSLAWDPDHRLMWAGTDAGLVVLSGEQAISAPLPEEFVKEGFEITFVHRFPDGELWLGDRRGAVISLVPRVSLSEERVSYDSFAAVLPRGESDGFVVRGILESRDGSRWVARNRNGVMQYSDGDWISHSPESIGCERSDCLFEAADGTIWVSGAGQPCAFDGKQWTLLNHQVETKFFAQLDDGNYYVGDSNGQVYVSEAPTPRGDPLRAWNDVVATRVRAVEILNDSLLWVGVKEGILLGTRPRWRERSFVPEGTDQADSLGFFTSNEQWPLALRANGTMIQFDPEAEQWIEIAQLPVETVTDPKIAAPREGICWIRSGPDVFKVDLRSKQVLKKVSLPEGFIIHDLECHSDGRLFVVGEQGGYYLAQDEWIPSLGTQPLYSIELSRNGDLIVALSNDIQRWRDDQRILTLEGSNRYPTHPFTFVTETFDGNVLAGTRGLGLKVFKGASEETVSARDHLLSSRILSAFDVPGGALWVGFDNLGVAARMGNRWVNYSAADGLDGGEVQFVGQDPGGHIWACKSNSEAYRYEGDSGRPETTITDAAPIVSSGETIVFGVEGYDAWGHTAEPELEFSWRLVEHRAGSAIAGEWSDYSSDPAVSIKQGLNAGRYTFEVKSQDRDFNVDPIPDSRDFEVLPPIWSRSTFLAPVGLLSALALLLAIRLVVQHGDLRRHRDRLNEEVGLRTKELEQANASLSEEKNRLMVTLQSIGDGIIVTNTAFEIVVFNPAAETLFRVQRKIAIGRSFESVVRLWTGKGMESVENPVRSVIEEGFVITRSSDVFLVREDGSSVEVS